MKKSKQRVIILMIIMLGVLCILFMADFERWFQTVTLQSENVKIIKENGVVTSVKFEGPFEHNKVNLDLETEIIRDENGNVKQVISTYEGLIQRKFLEGDKAGVQIKSSKSVEYVYIFKCTDKQIVVANGIVL